MAAIDTIACGLQWGRDHPIAETGDTAVEATAGDFQLQWGRDHPIAETRMIGYRIWSLHCSLQWGRDHPIAETRYHH